VTVGTDEKQRTACVARHKMKLRRTETVAVVTVCHCGLSG
jgi:hypothetical protein